MRVELPAIAALISFAGCGTNSASGVSCAAGEAYCAGVCIDVESDDANCGGCGLGCEVGCSKGRCLVTLAFGQNPAGPGDSPSSIALDRTSVYWTNIYSIAKVPLGGGAITTVFAPQRQYVYSVAVDATNVYWLTQTGGPSPLPVSGAVVTVPVGGGEATTIVSVLDELPIALAVGSTRVYWTSTSGIGLPEDPSVGRVEAAPLGGLPDGDAPITFYSSTRDTSPDALALDALDVYWVSNRFVGNSGVVMKAPLNGGASTTLASPKYPLAIAVDATSAYWAGDTVAKVPLGGGMTTTLASPKETVYATGIAVDATSVYWLNPGSPAEPCLSPAPAVPATVMKVPLSGGSPVTLFAGENPLGDDYPLAIAVDATSVYWTDFSRVRKLTPK